MDDSTELVVAAPTALAPAPRITLRDFAVQYAETGWVETMGAFLSIEQQAGRLDDAVEGYLGRYAAFRTSVA